MIQVKNLYKEFDGRNVLEDISIDYPEGKCSLIIGASGSGKTVLLKCLVGLLQPEKGDILYEMLYSIRLVLKREIS
jgi:ABC-type transport system involved in resistance to organic solvents, ATPase component